MNDNRAAAIISALGLSLIKEISDRRGHSLFHVADREGRQYALKLGAASDLPTHQQPFNREILALERLADGGVVGRIRSSSEERWLLIPWISGRSASEICREFRDSGNLDRWAKMRNTFLSMATILAQVHEAGFVHGDLQGAHLLFDEQGSHLIDFGMSPALSDQRPTPEGGMVHSNSPELCKKILSGSTEPTHDLASEIFSFCSVLFFLASGRLPFEHSPAEIAYEDTLRIIQDSAPLSLQSVVAFAQKELSAVITKCHHRDPSQRWASVREIVRVLSEPSLLSPPH